MDFVKYIWVCYKHAKEGIGAKQDRPSAVFATWIEESICFAEDASAQSDEMLMSFWFYQTHTRLFHFKDQNLKRANVQFFGIKFHDRSCPARK
jgi:hypothetical protein